MKVLLLIIANESNKLYVKLIEIYSLLAKQNIEWLDIYILINDSTLTNIMIEDNIKYNNGTEYLTADIIKINLLTKKIEIFMKDKNNEIQIYKKS